MAEECAQMHHIQLGDTSGLPLQNLNLKIDYSSPACTLQNENLKIRLVCSSRRHSRRDGLGARRWRPLRCSWTLIHLRRQAEITEHVGASPLADAGEQDAAVTADAVLVVGEERVDELPRAPLRHPHHRVVAVVVAGDGEEGRRQ